MATQLENFRAQLKKKEQRQEPKIEKDRMTTQVTSLSSNGKKQVWIPRETYLRAKSLVLWLETQNNTKAISLGIVFSEALNLLIKERYPEVNSRIAGPADDE